MNILINTWKQANHWKVGRFVIMPDHVHLFCVQENTDCSLVNWITYWKRTTSKNWHIKDKPLWQDNFWDTRMRSSEKYEERWLYILNNPVRAGLVNHYREWEFAGEIEELCW